MDELSLILRQQQELLKMVGVVIDLLTVNISQGVDSMQALEDLKAQVAESTAVEESAIKLIEGLAAQIAANTTDPAALTALSDSLKASAASLAAAITANTPAAPAPPAPAPEPPPSA